MKRFFAHIGFSGAVSLLVINLIPFSYVFPVLAGLCVLFIASLVIKKYRQALCVPVCLASAIFSIAVFICFYKSSVEPCLMLDGKSSEAMLYITSLPEKTVSGYAYTAKTIKIDASGAVQNITVRMFSDEMLTVKPYRIIKANVRFFSSGDNAFSSFGYWSKNIYLYANLIDFSFTDYRVKSLLEPLLNLRAEIISTIKANVKSDAGALSVALITGDKSGLSDNVNSMFKAAGASHLMAVSGLHLSVSVGFAVFVMKKLHFNDKVVFSLSLVIIFCYSAVAGFSKSIVRAGIMMAVMLLGTAVKKRSDTLNSLGLALFIICLNPFAVSDIGMSLSTLAVLAIAVLYPVLRKNILKLNNVKEKAVVKSVKSLAIYVLNAISLSLAVMIFTLPVMYIYFGYVSLASLVSNIILSPLGSCSLVLSLLSFAFSKVGFLSSIMFKITEFLCNAMIFIVKIFASTKYSTVHLGNYFAFVIAGVMIIFAVCFFLCNKHLMKKAVAVCSIIVIFFACVMSVSSKNYVTLYVSNNSSVAIKSYDCVIVCYADDSDYYNLDSFLSANDRKIDYLFVENKNCKKAVQLSNKYNCPEITSVCFDEAYLSETNAQSVIVAPNNKVVAENIIFSYNCTDGIPYYILSYNDSNVLIGDAYSEDCDIIIKNDYSYDVNGCIDLSKGDIEYTISSKNIFNVRRVGSWQD